MADLSKEKGQQPFPQWAFIGFNLHRNTGKALQSLSGSNYLLFDHYCLTMIDKLYIYTLYSSAN